MANLPENNPRSFSPEAILIGGGGRPASRLILPMRLSELGSQYQMITQGDDLAVQGFGPLSRLKEGERTPILTYASSVRWAEQCPEGAGAIVITNKEGAKKIRLGNSCLITELPPKEVFYEIFADAIESEKFSVLSSWISSNARIAPSAQISGNVYIEDGAVIGPGVVLLPNTYVGKNAVIKANAVIGGEGFEPVVIRGERRISPHAGGVWISEGVHIGSVTCIDRGLFGEFTVIGDFTLVDNLVHIAHSVNIGTRCSITACAEISGSTVIGNGVWIGPNSAVNQLVELADSTYLGTGSVVTKSLPDYALAYGNPANAKASVCDCRMKLNFRQNRAVCECGRRFQKDREGNVTRA